MEIRIEAPEAMAHGETRTFEFPRNGRTAQGFVIRYREGFYAYHNQCCHWPVALDMGDGDFYYAAADRILCKTHGAAYQPDTGYCDFGPCVRATLEGFPLQAGPGYILVTVPD